MKNLVMLLMLVAVFTFTLTACQQSDNEEQDIKSAASHYLSLEQVTAMLVEKGFYDRKKTRMVLASRTNMNPRLLMVRQ